MAMKKIKRVLALSMALATAAAGSGVPSVLQAVSAEAASAKYTVSKAGNKSYTGTQKVKITAKKGYKVYYTLSGAFSKKKIVKSGKSVTLTIKKTSNLKVYAVKSTKTLSASQLKAAYKKAKSYKYTIRKDTSQETDSSTKTGDASGSTGGSSASGSGTSDGSADGTGSSASGSGTESGTAGGTGASGGTSGEGTTGGTSGTGTTGSGTAGGQSGQQNQTTESNQVEKPSNADSSLKGTSGGTESVTESEVKTLKLSSKGSSGSGSVIERTSTAGDAVEETAAGSAHVITIKKAGTYRISGGSSSSPVENVQIKVDADAVLVLDGLYLDDSGLGSTTEEQNPVIDIAKELSVKILLSGTNELTGNGKDSDKNILTAGKKSTLTIAALEGAETASLTMTDPFYGKESDTEKGEKGINAKGNLVIKSGVFTIRTGGKAIDCGKTLDISGGSFDIDTYGDGMAADDDLNISGNAYVDIKTYFHSKARNYYSDGTNTLTSSGDGMNSNSTKTETVTVDTGSHKGLKGGTKAKTVTVKGTALDSESVEKASGGIHISGNPTILIDTTETGTKSSGMAGMGDFSGTSGTMPGQAAAAGTTGTTGGAGTAGTTGAQQGNMPGSGFAGGDQATIVGCPEDGIHSNNTLEISGGTIYIAAADDGITAAESISITGKSTRVGVATAYEAMEGKDITIGTKDAADGPEVTLIGSDDGINAAYKTVTYNYDTEEAAKDDAVPYTKTSVSEVTGCQLTVHSGKLTVTSGGDGLDSNGGITANGGTIIVFGPTNGADNGIDVSDVGGKFVNNGAEILAFGSASGMSVLPDSSSSAAYVVFGSTGGMGGFGRQGFPGGQGMQPPQMDGTNGQGMQPPQMNGQTGQGTQTGQQAGTNGQGTQTGQQAGTSDSSSALSIQSGQKVQITGTGSSGKFASVQVTVPKAYSYVFYSSSALVSGNSYALVAGGSEAATASAKK